MTTTLSPSLLPPAAETSGASTTPPPQPLVPGDLSESGVPMTSDDIRAEVERLTEIKHLQDRFRREAALNDHLSTEIGEARASAARLRKALEDAIQESLMNSMRDTPSDRLLRTRKVLTAALQPEPTTVSKMEKVQTR